MQGICYRGVDGLEEQKEERRVVCGGKRERRGLLPQDQEAAFGLESRSLHSQTAADLLLQLTRNWKPALHWCVQLPAVLPRCSPLLLLQTDQKWAKRVLSLILPPSLSSLWQDLTGSQLAKNSGKCSLQAFSSGDTERSIGSASVA